MNMTIDSTRPSSSGSEEYTTKSESNTSYSLLDDQLLAMRSRLCQSIVLLSSTLLKNAQNISKNDIFARNIALNSLTAIGGHDRKYFN